MKAKRRLAKLATRQREFDSMRSEGGKGHGKWVKTHGVGKNQFFHRPGSNKV